MSFKANFKAFLFIVGILIIISFMLYTDHLVGQLREQLREFLKFKISVLEENINREPGGEVSFIFDKIIRTADFPIIYTDQNNNPIYWKNLSVAEIPFDSLTEDVKKELLDILNSMDKLNPPIPIRYGDMVLGYYHYGDSPIIIRLQRLPVVEIAIVVLFIFLGYLGFSSIKKNEKRIIWVGMAKETAHQLGTPTSSLIGWLELLEQSGKADETIITEMKHDVKRLMKITERFSKIGSTPRLVPLPLKRVIDDTIDYFQRRLPNQGKKIQFEVECEKSIEVLGNRDLLEWTFENLIKNALDAIEKDVGIIQILVHSNHKWHYIDIRDNGKGMDFNLRKKIFEAGFSTKKRGWGLGLSLVKRIITEYHKGKIFVLDSKPGEGTTFRIQLPIKI